MFPYSCYYTRCHVWCVHRFTSLIMTMVMSTTPGCFIYMYWATVNELFAGGSGIFDTRPTRTVVASLLACTHHTKLVSLPPQQHKNVNIPYAHVHNTIWMYKGALHKFTCKRDLLGMAAHASPKRKKHQEIHILYQKSLLHVSLNCCMLNVIIYTCSSFVPTCMYKVLR